MRILLQPTLAGLILLATTSVAYAQEAPAAPAACPMVEPAVFEMDFEEFDSSQAGWRRWGEQDCEREGAVLIKEYRDRHSARLDPSQVKLLDWHAGQLFAAAGDYGFAIEHFVRAEEQQAEPVLLEYTRATLAFLRSDRAALVGARERMMAIPEPASFARSADRFVATYNLPRPTWPMNLEVVDGLIACFGWSYEKAYSCPSATPNSDQP